jgi:hypothetical protein
MVRNGGGEPRPRAFKRSFWPTLTCIDVMIVNTKTLHIYDLLQRKEGKNVYVGRFGGASVSRVKAERSNHIRIRQWTLS